jgi:alkaline phosphatase
MKQNTLSKRFFFKPVLVILLVFSCLNVFSQNESNPRMHSHNDYNQNIPFWKALSAGLTSIEVDVYLQNEELYVTHSKTEIIENRTIETLYLRPLQNVIALGLGEFDQLQLLVDVKSEARTTLDKFIQVLEGYPDLQTSTKISIVISGNRPPVEEYINYPNYIQFDHQKIDEILEEKLWEKVALISLNFRNYSTWNGTGSMTETDYQKAKTLIDQAHFTGKPFRFWGIPDTKDSWTVFKSMGINFLNTDDPIGLSAFLNQ